MTYILYLNIENIVLSLEILGFFKIQQNGSSERITVGRAIRVKLNLVLKLNKVLGSFYI